MYFDVSELLQQPVGDSQNHQISESHLLTEDGAQGKVTGSLKLMRTERGIWAKGELEAMVLSSCGRCLSDFGLTLPLRLQEQYYPAVDLPVRASLPQSNLEDKDLALCIPINHVLDVREVVRQLIVTAVPLKPLCKNGCLGLCAECGVNRNEESCDCSNSEEKLGVSPLIGLLSGSADPV